MTLARLLPFANSLCVLAWLLAGPPTAAAQSSTPFGALCVNQANGQVRFVAAADTCRASETRLTLDQFTGPQGPAGPAGPQGPKGDTGATGARGTDGTSVIVRAATSDECPAGGIVVSDATVSLPVCNGARGLTGETGAAGVPGPTGPEGPAGPAGTLPLNEDTAVVAVDNLLVQIGTLKPFRPTATSRIGIDVPIITQVSGTAKTLHAGPPQVPAFKLLLGADAPLNELRSMWQQTLQGSHIRFTAIVSLQHYDKGTGTDLLRLRLIDCLLNGFSDGSLSPASLVIQPESVNLLEATGVVLSDSMYDLLDLPIVTSPSLQVDGGAMALHRFSGGETTTTFVPDSIGDTRGPGLIQETAVSDLALVALARTTGGETHPVNSSLFDQLFAWADDIIRGVNSLGKKTVTIRVLEPKGDVLQTFQYVDAIPARINIVNPLLVDPATRMAPYVFDLRIRPSQPPTVQ